MKIKKCFLSVLLVLIFALVCSCTDAEKTNKIDTKKENDEQNQEHFVEPTQELATVSACFLEYSSQFAQEYHEFISTDSQYLSKIILSTNHTVTDFMFFELDADVFANQGEYKMGKVLYTLDKFTPEKPVVLGLEFLGVFPHHAICFKNTDGSVEYRYFLTSGKDGSLIYEEFEPGEKAFEVN